jgi:hypothetical protein
VAIDFDHRGVRAFRPSSIQSVDRRELQMSAPVASNFGGPEFAVAKESMKAKFK